MKTLLPTLRRILCKDGYKTVRGAEGLYEGMNVSVHNGCCYTTVVVEQTGSITKLVMPPEASNPGN